MNVARFIFGLSIFCISGLAFAQQTPRERIVETLEQGPANDAPADQDLPMQTGVIDSKSFTKIAPLPQLPAAPKLPETPAPDNTPDSAEALAKSDAAQGAKTVDVGGKDSPTKSPRPRLQTSKTATPFYLSAEEYLDIRGADTGGQTVLEYRVEVEALDRETPLRARQVTLVIGDDYTAITSGLTTKIYDFRLGRLLSLAPYYAADGTKTDKLQFDNVSLYAKAYRNISAVRGATQAGNGKKVQIGQNKFIDKFWIESAMSWAAELPETALVVDEQADSLSIIRDKFEVFTAEFTDENYSSPAMKDSFLVFANHELSIHPLIMKRLTQYDSPIKYMEIMSYGPNTPDGQKQIWSLTGRPSTKGNFPLSDAALSVTQRDPVSPLVFVINEAAHGRALDGKKSAAELQANFDEKFDGGDEIQAWFIGQEYLAHTGIDCEQETKNPVCVSVLAYESAEAGERTHAVQRYFVAARLAKDNSVESRTELIKTVKPNLADQSAPAFIYRHAAMARAKLTKQQAADAGLSDMSAEALLKLSLVKDPYDPNTYMGLAQVLAANGAFEQSWDIYDAMRAQFPSRDDLSMKINRVEKKLRATAPGYFLTK